MTQSAESVQPLWHKRSFGQGPNTQRDIQWGRYEGYFFIAPLFLGIIGFILVPIAASFYMSFQQWDMIDAPNFIGIRNYVRLLTNDLLFWTVLGNTFRFAALSIPPAVIVPLLLAVLVNRRMPGVKLYRMVFFLPLVTSAVAVGLAWRWIYDGEFGLANYLLSLVGIDGPNWLSDPAWAMLAVVIVTVWQGLGYNMVIYLSGLQGIPEHLYEAAIMDGANGLDQFFRITVPLLTPQTFFILVMSVLGSFQSFGLIYIMTSGGPVNSTNVYIYYLWQTAFGASKMGTASAMAWILALIMFAITLVQLRLARHWVHY